MLQQSNGQAGPASAACPFHKGDRVYLEKGSYQGTIGTFLNLRTDPKWADILEPNDKVRAHPVEWMALSTPEVGTKV
jgi:hypothetical protein